MQADSVAFRVTYKKRVRPFFLLPFFPVFRCRFAVFCRRFQSRACSNFGTEGILFCKRMRFLVTICRQQGVLRSSAYDFFNDCGRTLVKGVENHLFCAENCKAAFAGGLHKKDKRPISFATFFRAKFESHAFSKLRSKYCFASDGIHSRAPQSLRLRRNLTHRTMKLWGTKTVKNSTAYPICRRALALP